jgi:16S rRNA (guanine527-N7)-methyltransferase
MVRKHEGQVSERDGVGQKEGDGDGVGVDQTSGSHLIERQARDFGVPLGVETAQAIESYFALLLRWGARINLTAARSLGTLVSEHLPDALAIAARLAMRAGAAVPGHERLIDVGSGGGLPAIPLALLRPMCALRLVEATGKKVAFLRTAVRELGLSGRVEVRQRRIELGQTDADGGVYDGALSRAMLPPEEWLPLARELVRVGGAVFCLSAHSLRAPPPGLTLVHQAPYRQVGGQSERWVAELTRST